MPALLEDPDSPLVYRVSGQGPYPTADNPQIPSSIFPRPVTLRDRVTIATLIPFFSPDQVPKRLLAYLCENLNKEIDGGDTYPMLNPLPLETFGPYWFGNFGAVMVLGDIGGIEQVTEMELNGTDWTKLCLGSFYVKPNYPGRSSHVCNGGFLVTPAARNKGVGKSMGQCYLDWAPQLGYTYSVFNLVYETNTASTRIWDSLGFKRIGRIPGCGNLKSSSEPVDAIIYGRDLKAEGESVASEERFDKIRYYLRHSLYPQGADRSEKSRLRSAATHYKLVGGQDGTPEKLMLKDKEVISDPAAQYDIAKTLHLQAHGGINKTTAMIATKYHWVRIKETVSHVIKHCPECKETNKPPIIRTDANRPIRSKPTDGVVSALEDSRQPMENLPAVPNEALQPNHLSESNFAAMAQTVALPTDDGMQSEAELAAYDEMSLDPHQFMDHLQMQVHLDSDLVQHQHHHSFVDNHMSTFGDPTQFDQVHPSHDYGGPQNDHFMHDTGSTLISPSQVMAHHDGPTGMTNIQPMPHGLPMDYMSNDVTNRYKE